MSIHKAKTMFPSREVFLRFDLDFQQKFWAREEYGEDLVAAILSWWKIKYKFNIPYLFLFFLYTFSDLFVVYQWANNATGLLFFFTFNTIVKFCPIFWPPEYELTQFKEIHQCKPHKHINWQLGKLAIGIHNISITKCIS